MNIPGTEPPSGAFWSVRTLTRPATVKALRPSPGSAHLSRLPFPLPCSLFPVPYSLLSRLDQAFLDSEEDQFRGAVEIESLHQARAVYCNCIDADIKQGSNFLVGFSLGD